MADIDCPVDKCSWINEYAPTTNYSTQTTLRLGDALDAYSKTAYPIMRFDVSDIPAGSVIDQVAIVMYLDSKDWATSTSAYFSVRELLRTWTEDEVTWNKANSATSWDTPGAEGTGVDSSAVIAQDTRANTDAAGEKVYCDSDADLIALVQAWVDGTKTNYGIVVTSAAPGTAARKNAHKYRSSQYGSDEPFLYVEYTPDTIPVVITTEQTTATAISLTGGGGDVTADGGDTVTERGICFSESNSSPTPAMNKLTTAGTTGAFSLDITGLKDGTLYYYRAYATNSLGTGYGEVFEGTTADIITTNGVGGTGVSSSISGTSHVYGSGGGGGSYDGLSIVGTNKDGAGRGGSPIYAAGAGTANRGGGGGGGAGSTYTAGGAGGSGIAIIKYLTADAISATPELASTTFTPSLAYHNGLLFAPFARSEGSTILDILGNTQANPTVVTAPGHDLVNGQAVAIEGSLSTPSIDGVHVVSNCNTGAGTFTVPVDVDTTAGEATTIINHITHPSLEIDTNSDGLSDGLTAQDTCDGTPTFTRVAGRLDTYAQKFVYTATAGDDAGHYAQLRFADSDVGSFINTDKATFSVYAKGTCTGCQAQLIVGFDDAGGSFVEQEVKDITLTTSWARYEVTDTASNATVSRAYGIIRVSAIEDGDAFDVTFDNAMLEKDDAATDYFDGDYGDDYFWDGTADASSSQSVQSYAGTLSYNAEVGYSYSAQSGFTDGELRTSGSSFHTGSMLKDFKHVIITHEPLPTGSSLTLDYVIDGNDSVSADASETITAGDRQTKFLIDEQGYAIDVKLGILAGDADATTPVVNGINVIWNFVQIPKHIYTLDCRAGSGSGRWAEVPDDAIRFLFDITNESVKIEDRFAGEYTGTVEGIEYTQSAFSLAEGPSGLVKLQVREEI